MDAILAICAGVALAAACGFRVFLPLLAMSIGAATGALPAGKGMEWVGSTPTLIVLGVATVLEIAAYYIPVVDHFLDTIASPAAVIAGTVAAGALMPTFGDHLHPAVKWALALVAGGGAAGVVQAGTVSARAVSGMTTGTVGNPIVATVENVLSIILSILAIVVPIVAALLVLIVFVWVGRIIARWRRKRVALAAAASPVDVP